LKCKAEFKDSVGNSDLVAMVVPAALVQVDPVADEEAEAVVKPQWSSMADPSPSQQPQSEPQRLQHLPQLKEAKEAKVEPDKETKEVEADKTVKTTNKMTSKTPSAT
jgi:hypothetical protein